MESGLHVDGCIGSEVMAAGKDDLIGIAIVEASVHNGEVVVVGLALGGGSNGSQRGTGIIAGGYSRNCRRITHG